MGFLYFQAFISQMTNDFYAPLSAAILIEMLSSLQIIQLIFSTMAEFSPDSHFIITSLYKNLRYLTGSFPLEETSVADSILLSIWIICLIYLVLHLDLLLIAIRSGNKKEKRLFKVLSWLNLIHSRLLFFPIQFFLLNLCDLYTSPKNSSNVAFYQHPGWLVGSLILLVMNTGLALCKEFIMYQMNQTENNYAIKTNIYHQLMLIYKILALLLNFWSSSGTSAASKGSCVFHLIMGIFLLFILYVKLPFYNFSVLKVIIVLSTVLLCLSGISLIYVFTVQEDSEASGGMHILILLLPPLGIKLILSQFQSLFKRILQGEFMVAEHAIHFGLLLEDFVIKEKISWMKYGSFFPAREDYYGVLALLGDKIPLEKFTDRKLIYECELPMYLHITEKLSLINSSSKQLALYIAQISLTKVHNIPKALEILRKLESSSDSFSISMKTSIQYLNDLLERMYNENDLGSDNGFNLTHYLKYHDVANSVKSLMLAETNKQIDFWKEIQQKNIDAKKLYDKVEEIDRLFIKIRKECGSNLNNFRKNCTSPMLLYSVYLNHVRQMQSEGIQVLRSFQSIMFFAQNGSNELEAASGNVAVVTVSLDKAKAGIILNASGSIHNLFSYKKTDIVGKKFGCLFQSSLTKNYQQNILQYAKILEFKIDYKERTYGKTSNDEIFELEAQFQLHPDVNKELTMIIMFKKLDEPAPLLIANGEGNIIDWSKTLKSLNMTSFHSLKNLNSGLEDANLAFNMVYGKVPEQVQSTGTRETKSWFNSENIATDFEEPSKCTRRSLLHGFALSSGRMKKPTEIAGGMSFDKAEEICGEYQEGKQIVIDLEKKSQAQAYVIIKPLKVAEEIYKIVRINQLKKDRTSIFESSNKEDVTFADEFPAEIEKMCSTEIITAPLRSPQTKGTIELSVGMEAKKPCRTSLKSDFENDTHEPHRNLKIIQQGLDQDEGSSIRSSHHVESRTVRTLRDIGSRKKLQRNLCSLQILLYVMIAVILALSFVKFELSKDSIEEIEKGISIINLATLRLQNGINTFLWSLIYIIGGVDRTQAMGYFTTSLARFAKSSTELQTELGFVRDQELLSRAFQKDVRYWQLPVRGDSQNGIVIDTFSATNILMTKYLAIHEAQDLLQIFKIPDLIQIFNNTVNDYIISSNKLISATDDNLDEVISKDISLLKVVLSTEIVALVAYVSVFILMIYIVSKSYSRLYRALLRTQDVAITQRISQLNKVKVFLEDDLERKAFIQDAFDLFNDERRSLKKINNVKAQKSNVQMSLMNRYLVRIALICLFFIPIFASLFIGTLVKSIQTFTTLESVNEELSMLSDGSFQSNLMMSTLIYGSLNAPYPSMLFMNQAPLIQVGENFKNFNELNQRLIETFLSSSERRQIDPFLVEILQTSVCEHLSDASRGLCEYATNDQNIGLLSLNIDYYNILQNIVASLGLKTSLANALAGHKDTLNKIIGEMNAMTEIYPIMMSHVLVGFEETVQASKNDEKVYIVVIFVSMIVYVVFIYLKPLKDFQRVDLGRRKILKILPVNLIQENKALKFYLMQDFKTEVEEIKNKF